MTIEEFMNAVIAVEHVDELEFHSWMLSRADELRNEFYQSGWPTLQFPIWVRKRFLESTEQASPAPAKTPPAPCLALTQGKGPATRSAYSTYMFELASEKLQ